jgi:phosphatidylserine/phosphatidylglycerophosphate/cardiolipin synthase-like enzyme/uncharacterized membrane protein YdjX (TVP38/TMEM64 family)
MIGRRFCVTNPVMAPRDLIPTSLFRPGGNCCAAVRSARAAFLVDGEAYFDAFVRACERAERTIVMLGWDFDSRMVLRYDDDGTPRETLGAFLNRLCERNRHLRIHILDWDFPVVFGGDREYSPIFGLNWEPHRRIEFRFDDTHPVAGSHHQKIVVVDDKVAFVGGLDLTNKRWDSPAHQPGDPRRTFEDAPYPPFHDVMAALDADAATALLAIAKDRWQKATGHALKPARRTHGDPWPPELEVALRDVLVSVSCTLPEGPNTPAVRQVESLYLDMIGRARRYIYIENQYFTSDSIGRALKASLEQPDGPEIVLVTRLLSHGWLEENTMSVLRTRLVRLLREADRHGRFHAYYPHVEGLIEGTCLDLHSKVMVVDDEWLRVGSSNLSNRSMGVDTEADVTIEAEGRAEVRDGIRLVRDRLISEHAGVDIEAWRAAAERAGSLSAAIDEVAVGQRRLIELETPEVSDAVMAAAAIGDMEKPISLDVLVQGLAHDESPLQLPAPKPPRRIAVLGTVALVVAAMLAMWRYTPLSHLVTADSVIDIADTLSTHWWAPLVLVLAYTPACMVMFPRPLITMAAVVVFGPVHGLAYAMTGVLLAGVAGYFVGKLVHRDTVRRLAGPRLARLTGVLQRRGIIAVTLVRFVPIAPYAVVNVVMGAMRIRFAHFLAGTFLGMLPGAIAATVLSDQAAEFLRDPSRVNPWLVAAAAGGFVLLAYTGKRLLAVLDRTGVRRQSTPMMD